MARSLLLLSLFNDGYDLETVPTQRKIRTRRKINTDVLGEEYVNIYRLTKELIEMLEQDLSAIIPTNKRQSAIHLKTKILIALSILANGGYQKIMSKVIRCEISQPSMSRSLHQIVDAMCHTDILKKYLKFPQNNTDRQKIKDRFFEKFGIPDVIGCIDSTLVAMVKPKGDEGQIFCINGDYAKNVQLICDADYNIIHVDSSFGASDDSFIFNNSAIKKHMEELHNSGETVYLLGDSDYPQKPYLLTPIVNAAECTPDAYYNKLHSTAHNVAQQLIGMLKSRFRCLLVHQPLHYRPDMVTKIIITCCVLHNICNSAGLPAPSLSPTDVENEKKLVFRPSAEERPSLAPDLVELAMSDANKSSLVYALWQTRS